MDIPVEMSNRHLNYINSEFRVMSLIHSLITQKLTKRLLYVRLTVTAMGMLI